MAAVFEETAANEQAHAGLFYEELAKLAPGALEITAGYPVVAGDTAAQLKAAVAGENEEWSALYPEFARIAREEDFPEAARVFECDRQGGKGARGPVPPAAGPRGERHGVPARREDLLALPGVRPHPRGRRGAQGLPGLPEAPGLVRPGRRPKNF